MSKCEHDSGWIYGTGKGTVCEMCGKDSVLIIADLKQQLAEEKEHGREGWEHAHFWQAQAQKPPAPGKPKPTPTGAYVDYLQSDIYQKAEFESDIFNAGYMAGFRDADIQSTTGEGE